MDGGGLTGQTQMPPVEFSPMICFPQAFTWNGLKGLLGMIVVSAIIFAYVKLNDRFGSKDYDERGFKVVKSGTYIPSFHRRSGASGRGLKGVEGHGSG